MSCRSGLPTHRSLPRTHDDQMEQLLRSPDNVNCELLLHYVAKSAKVGGLQATPATEQAGHDAAASVRTDDGKVSEWLEVTQALRQGCVLSPLLFSIPPLRRSS